MWLNCLLIGYSKLIETTNGRDKQLSDNASLIKLIRMLGSGEL